jgi:hypothetical protein
MRSVSTALLALAALLALSACASPRREAHARAECLRDPAPLSCAGEIDADAQQRR